MQNLLSKPLKLSKSLGALLLSLLPLAASAQLSEGPGHDYFAIDSARVGTLEAEVEATAFFRDNEYDGTTTRGYSLPGAWVRPKLVYTPASNVRIEAGAHALFFHGANKYPCYVYHDIGTWKGNQYQPGAHVLPWFRAEMAIGSTRFVLGDIYGDVNHRFATPIYNKEQLFSADPEAGFQILHHGRCFSADLFLNWQSYQFEEDTHQEAFSVGLSSSLALVGSNDMGRAPADGSFRLTLPVQILLQHRGGEQDVSSLGLGVQTVANGLLGVKAEKRFSQKALRCLAVEADLMGCYQQKGSLWPFGSGAAAHLACTASLWQGVNVGTGYFHAPKNFVSLYGSPFFSTISLKTPGERYSRRSTAYLQLGYSRTVARHYTFGADLEFFHSSKGDSRVEDVFSFGVYMRLSPSAILTEIKKL